MYHEHTLLLLAWTEVHYLEKNTKTFSSNFLTKERVMNILEDMAESELSGM